MTQLLMTDNSDLIQLFQEISRSLKIDLEIAESLEEAEKKIGQAPRAYIFSPMPFNILPWITKVREDPSVPIAFIYPPNVPFTASYSQLKEEYQVNYILDAPLQKEEVEALLKCLEGTAEPVPINALAAKIPPHLRASYAKSINQKIERIEGLVKDISNNPAESRFAALKQEIHKIAGSAASYGYPKVSELCQAWEAYLAQKMIPSLEPDPALSNTLNHFLRIFKLSFQYIYPDYSLETLTRTFRLNEAEQPFLEKKMGIFLKERFISEPESPVEAQINPLIYIVSADKQFIAMAKSLVKESQMQVVTESNPKAALYQLGQHALTPSILIVEQTYPDSIVDGLELVSSFETQATPGTSALILNEDHLEDHHQAMQGGVDYILKRPISREGLAYLFNASFKVNTFPHFKVLIVDDDMDICNFVTDSLKEIGIQVEILTDDTQILEYLKKIHPHLLLLDINMPHYSGWQLLKIIRADVRYRHLGIVLITTIHNWSNIEKAYTESGDEILMKPFNRKALQIRISQIAKRLTFLESHLDRHPLTGYFNAHIFNILLRRTIWHALKEETWIGLVLLELDHQEQLKSALSFDEFEDIIVASTNILDFLILKDSLKGYISSGKFILVFEGYEASLVESLIHPFLLETKRSIQSSANIPITYSCGIAVSKKIHTSIDQLFKGAEEALTKAQISGGSTVILHHFTLPNPAESEIPELIIIEDDPDISELLIHIYETHGFKVLLFSTGKEALQYFSERRSLQKRTLILLERLLPDIDGIDLLKKIKKLFPQDIQAIFLSSLSAEKDILDGLKEGAIDYIAKPFNMSILLQKTNLILRYQNTAH